MRLDHLWLVDFRNYAEGELEPDPEGLTVIRGANGQGKTNLLEAVGYLATLESFRGVPREALVRQGRDRAIVRAEGSREGRRLQLEAEIPLVGRDRYLLNRQPLRRGQNLLGALRVSVFSPDDLALVQGPPALRRDLLDTALASLNRAYDAVRAEVDRVLRQRNALLRQAEGRLTPEVAMTLEVWDAKLEDSGTRLADQREKLVASLGPLVNDMYRHLCRENAPVGLSYRRCWRGSLAEALAAAAREDLRRGVTTVGPHRDDLLVELSGMPSRSHASQGEQRSLALSLRLAVHRLVTHELGSAPVLLLDDVFSELDPYRSASLLELLTPGQALLTTAGPVPEAADPALVVLIKDGAVVSA